MGIYKTSSREMEYKMFSKYLKNEKGMALAVVLMVLAVLSIISVGALTMAQAENKLSVEEKEDINSYALSKSGLEIVSKKLMADPTQIAGLLSAGTPITGTIGTGSFNVSLSGSINTGIKLTSQGSINGNTEITFLNLVNQSNPSGLFKNAVYSNAPLDLDKVNVSGPIQSAGSITAPAGYSSSLIHANTPIDYPTFEIPSPLVSKSDINLGNGSTTTITANNWSYNNITINNGGTLILGTTGSTTPINIVVDTLVSKGDVIVRSRVNLFVKDTLDIQTQGAVNSGAGGNPNKLYIFLGTPNTLNQDDPWVSNGTHPEDLSDGFNPNGVFSTQAAQAIKAYLYGPAAYMSTDSGNVIIEGGVICNQFSGKNNSDVIFVAPTSDPGGLNGIINVINKSKYTDQ